MGQIPHGSARTTATVCRVMQHSQESIARLAERYAVNPKTVAKWKQRTQGLDAPMVPKHPRSTILMPEEEALIVAFRKHTLLPLDDCLYALHATLPHLIRSALHRSLQRHGISRLPDTKGDKPAKKKFKPYPLGCCHIDIEEVRTEEGKLCLFIAIDRASTFAYTELHAKATKPLTEQFLRNLIAAATHKIHTVLTDNGIQFINQKRDQYAFRHTFARPCHDYGIDHRLTQTNHPWTNNQVECMSRTLKEVAVKKYYYQTHQYLNEYLDAFLMAYNFTKRLKTLKRLTPYEHSCRCWPKKRERFTINPFHYTLGLNAQQKC